MSETYCGLLNVLVLGLLAGLNGLQLRNLGELRRERHKSDSQPGES